VALSLGSPQRGMDFQPAFIGKMPMPLKEQRISRTE
jgi:hypothetical protein